MPPSTAPEVQLQILSRAARLLASAEDFNDTMRQTLGACLPELADFGIFDVVHDDGVRRNVAAHDAPDIEALLAPTQWARHARTDMNLCALSSGKPALHPNTDDAWYRCVATNQEQLDMLRRMACTSMITVPVRYRDEVVGALTLFMGRSGRRHTPQDVSFAAEVANLAAPVVVNARLVEQHRQAEEALRTSEERLRMATEAAQVGIWDWDLVRDHMTWSDRIYEMYEREPGTDTGGFEGFRARVHPEDFPKAEGSLKATAAGGPPYMAEFRTILPGGRTRWISNRGRLIRDMQGRPSRMVGASMDVTERVELLQAERRARDEAEAARRRLELLAKAGAVLTGSLDPDETLSAIASIVVPAVADWCRIDLLDETGTMKRRLAHHGDPQRAERALQMAREMHAAPGIKASMAWVMTNGLAQRGSFQDPELMADPVIRRYTETFGMREYYFVPLMARGRTIGAMAVVQSESGRGITGEDQALVRELAQRAAMALDNARLYAEAEATRRNAESANRAKDEFLAILGHELRNPLAPIASALELMALRNPAASVDERRVIGRQVAHLSRLIDDLLDVSRITQGKIQLRWDRVDMKAVVANAVELTMPMFDKHANPVELRLAQQPAVVAGDAVRLTQVLCNLLINAAKFTPPDGRVTLALDRVDGFIEASVQDTGSGIDEQLLPRVFDLFVQGEQSMDRRAGGLGLGLPIVRSLAQMHGGTVSAASDGPGKGSRFVVRLPASDQPTSPQAHGEPAATPAGGSGRILIVDDNADAADTLAEIFRIVGYEVRCAGHANAAMALLDSYVPRVALLDIGLPDIDGYQLAGLLRADPRAAGMKLVALTGYGRDSDRALALAAKFDEHLVKPATIDRLLEVLRELMPG